MKKAKLVLVTAGASCLAFASSAMAAITVDYAGLGTSIEGEITSALAVMVPLGGIVLAIGIAWKVGKRFVKG